MRASSFSRAVDVYRGTLSRYRVLNDGSCIAPWAGWCFIALAVAYSAMAFVLSFAVDPGHVLLPSIAVSALFFWAFSYAFKIDALLAPSFGWRGSLCVIPALVLAVYLPLVWKGMLSSPDMVSQWKQAMGIEPVNDWHPILHTYLIRLIACLARTPRGVAIVQVCIFAFLLCLLYATFRRYSYCRWASVLIVLVAAFNPFSMAIFRFIWKDSAFALAGLAVTICQIHVFQTRGDWLRGWRIPLMALCLTAATFLRHNGFFYTAPLAILLPMLVVRRNARKVFLCLGLAVLCCAGYLFARDRLTRSGVVSPRPAVQCFPESVGLPMCIMSECYMADRSKTPHDIVQFLESFGDREFWEKSYRGNFNSIKFKFKSEAVDEKIYALGKRRFFDMLWRTVRANPAAARNAFVRVTSIAWAPLPESLGRCATGFPRRGLFFKTLGWYGAMMKRTTFGVLLTAPGSYLLLVVLAFCYGMIKVGPKVCALVIPFICYQFGTMLLLTGNDHRFFYITVLCGAAVCLPIFSSARNCERDREQNFPSVIPSIDNPGREHRGSVP